PGHEALIVARAASACERGIVWIERLRAARSYGLRLRATARDFLFLGRSRCCNGGAKDNDGSKRKCCSGRQFRLLVRLGSFLLLLAPPRRAMGTRMKLPQFSYLCAANPSHQHQAPATIPSRRTEPPDACPAHRCQKNRHASHRLGECEARAAERKHCDKELYPCAPEH